MFRRTARWSIAACCALSFTASPAPADACVHASSVAATPVTQKGQRILAVHDGKVQTTVVQVDYEVGKGLESLAMVLPVPTVPSRYDTGDPKLFDALETWAPLQRQEPKPRSRNDGTKAIAAAAQAQAIELLPPVKTGPYAIQPIKARGAEGAKALGTWLSDNGYTPIPDEALAYYVGNEWAFLAVKTSPADGALDKSGALPPLSYSFETDRIVVPMRLEAQGVFPVRIYTVSTRVLSDADFEGALAKGFEVARAPGHGHLRGVGTPSTPLAAPVGAFGRATAPAELGAVFKTASVTAPELHLRVLFSEDFGSGAANPAKWTDELAVPKLAAAAGPGTPPADPEPEADAKAEPEADAKAEPEADAKAEPEADAKAEPEADAKTETKGAAKPGASKSAPAKAEPAKSCAVDRSQDPTAALWLLALLGIRRRRA